MSSSATSPQTKFPTHGLLPRADTQAADFVRKYPTYDGRGAVVAILDTGIDPGAKGLQVTSDGKRKVVDFVDCTGSGDVHLAAVPESDVNGSGDEGLQLKGATGRVLKLNPKWKNPTGVWRVGEKRLYDLIPGTLASRVKEERQTSFKKAAQRLSDAVASKQEDGKDAETKPELEAQSEVLKSFSSSYADPGPTLDCVVFHDGDQWRAAVDTDETGDLSHAEPLGAYKLTGDVGKLCKRQLFYYTLNFYDQGAVLSIVTNVGSHSTHVAGIVAANHPDEPQNNGVAPGAQLLSLMIGDHRVGSLETGVGLTRAANAIVEHGADLANMSYGEPSSTTNIGQWVQLVRREVVRRHRCIFVSSAGNEGPALSTVGAPGGTSDDIIGVGAYVGYEQIKAEYAMYDTVKDTVFTWCSRGPTSDGARGVDIYAPGSAIASYPAYTLQRLHLANGTSMSSPNLCGCLALLVSAWKQELAKDDQKISPYRVKNAILSTAKSFGGDALGAGLIQTDAAWTFLKKNVDRTYEDIEYAVGISELNNARGIYLRNAEDSAVPRHVTVNVVPRFPGDVRAELEKDTSGEHGEQQSQTKFDFEQRVILTTSESWVRVPEAVYISSEGRTFSVKIDATKLEPGRLHVAEINGYDSKDVDRGAIFSVPITVTKPLAVDASACVRFSELRFQPTEIVRRFIDVPTGATRAKITINSTNSSLASSAPATFYLHCLQLAPQRRFTQFELKSRVTIGHPSYVAGGGSAEQTYTRSMAVIGGNTLEVCIAPFWNQLDVHDIDVTVEFNGIVPVGGGVPTYYEIQDGVSSGVVVNGNTGIARVDFTAPVRPEYDFRPAATLDYLRTALRPVSSSISPLSAERDTHLASGVAIQKLVLDYKFSSQADKTAIRLRIPSVDSMIYENWADDFALQVFDANKKRVATQISYTSSITLEKKGDYLIRVQIRHRSGKDLEALKAAPLLIDTKLSEKVTLSTHSSHALAFTSTVSQACCIPQAVRKDASVPVFFKTAVSPLPKEAAPGDVLRGYLFLSNKTSNLALEYIVPAKETEKKDGDSEKKSSKPATADSSASGSDKKGEEGRKEEQLADKDRKELEDAIRKLRIEWIRKVKDESVRAELVSELIASAAAAEGGVDKASVLAAQLETIDKASKSLPWSDQAKFTEESADKAVAIADQIVELTYNKALTAKLFENQSKASSSSDKDKKDEKKAKEKEDATAAKKHLVNALTSKCRALAFLATQSSLSATRSEASAEFVDVAAEAAEERKVQAYDDAVSELTKWTGENAQDASHLLATLPLFVAKQQYGRALKPVVEWLAKAPLTAANAAERSTMVELRDQLLEKLQWTVWADHFKARALVDSPKTYASF
ncbi:hypothetical protein GGI12_002155 [Dipsacomyces acuminosporus]|nr:hypothetical protein GGI12_002155 [Dipsacomyces acuminosporus]